MQTKFHRPQPIFGGRPRPIDKGTPAIRAAERLCEGERLLVSDSYHTGAEVLAELERLLPAPPQEAGHHARRAHQREYRETATGLLAPISHYRLALKGARPIGFLQELYFELDDFQLPFIQVQELFGAWERYEEGVHLAVLGRRLHPFFGTYVPTRTQHLELFATWLSGYQGPKAYAVDVGTGSGVLALMLARAGFAQVLATDINPNAVESLARELKRQSPSPPVEPRCVSFFGDSRAPAELIVFNPPWLKGSVDALLDQALFYEEGLFEAFFDEALLRLAPEGRLVIIFSNIITLVQPEVPHPIEAELSRARLQLVSKQTRKVKAPRGEDGRRPKTREKVEVWEFKKAP